MRIALMYLLGPTSAVPGTPALVRVYWVPTSCVLQEFGPMAMASWPAGWCQWSKQVNTPVHIDYWRV
jgi:hypothetical protein